MLSSVEPAVDQSRLDAHQFAEIPFVRWQPAGSVEQNERAACYVSGECEQERIVKIWTGVRRGQSQKLDISMLAMFEGISRLRLKPQAGLPLFEDAGLSSVGPFVVYRRAPGTPLANHTVTDPADAAMIVTYLAAMQAGWYLTPINHHLTAGEIGYILGDCEAKAFIGSSRFAAACRGAADQAGLAATACYAVGDIPGCDSSHTGDVSSVA